MTGVVTTVEYEEAAREVLATVDAQIQALLKEAQDIRSVQEEEETQMKLAELRARLFGTDV
jgi:hypothetical protein